MKKLIYSTLGLAVAASMFLTSCKDDSNGGGTPTPEVPKPTITFETSSGYVFAATSQLVNTNVKIGIAVTHTINLKKLKITRNYNGGGEVILLDSTISGNTKTASKTLNNLLGANKGTYTYTISCTDNDATTATKTIVVTATAQGLLVVTIGTQVWTSKNLDLATYRNGDVIPEVQDKNAWANLTTGAWCYYDNDTSNGTKYGKLYNWYAVSDPRGLAPNGYHIPTDAEWTQLSDYLGGQSEAGRKMKSTTGWKDNGNGPNLSGFSGLPGGDHRGNGPFFGIDALGYWWSSTESGPIAAWYRYLYYNDDFVGRDYKDKRDGFSVRCLRD